MLIPLHYGVQFPGAFAFTLPCTLVFSLGIAMALRHTVELPGIRLRDRLVPPRGNPPQSPVEPTPAVAAPEAEPAQCNDTRITQEQP